MNMRETPQNYWKKKKIIILGFAIFAYLMFIGCSSYIEMNVKSYYDPEKNLITS